MAIAQACHTKSKCNLLKTRGGKMPTKYLFEILTTHPSVVLCMRLSKKESMTKYYGRCYSNLRPVGDEVTINMQTSTGNSRIGKIDIYGIVKKTQAHLKRILTFILQRLQI
jgi:hypothetical protein